MPLSPPLHAGVTNGFKNQEFVDQTQGIMLLWQVLYQLNYSWPTLSSLTEIHENNIPMINSSNWRVFTSLSHPIYQLVLLWFIALF